MRVTAREIQVIKLIAKGHTDEQIGMILNISCTTAQTHRKRILLKLGVNNSAAMVSKAYELKILAIKI